MTSKSGFRFSIRKLAAIAAVAAVAPLTAVATASTANAALDCGPSKFVENIKVREWDGGHFQIILTPTSQARLDAGFGLRPREAVVEQWHAIQRCVRGLEGDRADVIWDQLECHQLNAWMPGWFKGDRWATGDTYDLETWRPVLPRVVSGEDLALTTGCLNWLGVDPDGPYGSGVRPDAGQVDLYRAMANVA